MLIDEYDRFANTILAYRGAEAYQSFAIVTEPGTPFSADRPASIAPPARRRLVPCAGSGTLTATVDGGMGYAQPGSRGAGGVTSQPTTPVRFAPLRSAPLRSAPLRFAFIRFAPSRCASLRSAGRKRTARDDVAVAIAAAVSEGARMAKPPRRRRHYVAQQRMLQNLSDCAYYYRWRETRREGDSTPGEGAITFPRCRVSAGCVQPLCHLSLANGPPGICFRAARFILPRLAEIREGLSVPAEAAMRTAPMRAQGAGRSAPAGCG